MKPLICYISFNRMGSTVLSLLSLLKTKDDFDLYIGDNNSQDKTWDFLMSLKDERIKEVKRFEHNYGELNVANWAISKRQKGQDFIIMENDCQLCCDEFVIHFDRAFREFPNLGCIAGWLRSLNVDKTKMNGYLYPSTVMGYFTCTRGDVMDKLGYYSEACCLGDLEWNYRIRELLKMETGFINLIDCLLIHPWCHYTCAECRQKQSVCNRDDKLNLFPEEHRPMDLSRDLYCNGYYPILNIKFWNSPLGEEARSVFHSKIEGCKQVYWDSIHSGNPELEWQRVLREKYFHFFEDQYLQYLTTRSLKV